MQSKQRPLPAGGRGLKNAVFDKNMRWGQGRSLYQSKEYASRIAPVKSLLCSGRSWRYRWLAWKKYLIKQGVKILITEQLSYLLHQILTNPSIHIVLHSIVIH